MTDKSRSNPFQCIRLDQVKDVAVVRFVDEKVMDPARIEQLGQELLRLSEQTPQPKVVIDFSEVRFFSSAAINKLIVLEKRVKAQGGNVRLCRLGPEVRDLFGLTHLDRLFKIDEDPSQALSEINRGRDQ